MKRFLAALGCVVIKEGGRIVRALGVLTGGAMIVASHGFSAQKPSDQGGNRQLVETPACAVRFSVLTWIPGHGPVPDHPEARMSASQAKWYTKNAKKYPEVCFSRKHPDYVVVFETSHHQFVTQRTVHRTDTSQVTVPTEGDIDIRDSETGDVSHGTYSGTSTQTVTTTETYPEDVFHNVETVYASVYAASDMRAPVFTTSKSKDIAERPNVWNGFGAAGMHREVRTFEAALKFVAGQVQSR